MNKHLFLIICFSFLNCKNSETKIVNSESTIANSESTIANSESIKSNNKIFFDFDNVDYYFKDIDDSEILKEVRRLEGVDDESEEYNYLNLISNDYPKKVNDENFIKNILKFGYSKNQIDKKFYNEINSVFSETKCDSSFAAACVPIYRDILVFYKEQKIIGIAKVCFTCRQFDIIGTQKDISYFGQCGGYEKLYEILDSK